MGAVAPIPWRSPESEAALKGGPLDESRARAAAEAALKDAQPMSDNAYKVVIAKVIVRRAIMSAGRPWRLHKMASPFCALLRTKTAYYRTPDGERIFKPDDSTACYTCRASTSISRSWHASSAGGNPN